VILVLARVPALRLVRTSRAWGPIAGWAALSVVLALVARGQGSGAGASHVLRGGFAFVALPLVVYATVGATLGEGGLNKGVRGVVALGATARTAAIASVLVAIAVSMAIAGALAALLCLLAHGPQDPPLAADLIASLGVGALGGAAYASYFAAGAAVAVGKGTMRGVLLALDWILGGGAGVGALVTPRGHVASLLGGLPCAELAPRASSVVLLLLVVGYGALAVLLARRS
jgi:hypothetical protein